MTQIKSVTRPFVEVKQKNRTFIVTALPASDLTAISYVSVRGKDSEEGAVQRVLNPLRIASLREYALSGGDYSASIILNWVNKDAAPSYNGSQVTIPIVGSAAQIIDGQHRVVGLREAIRLDANVGTIEIPVAIYSFLETRACADIFLAINTEQKPVQKSLVIDLYGVASPNIVDPAQARARDIASEMNTEEDSPYYSLIRFPGAARSQIGVDLSTVTSAIKPLVEDKGALEAVGITELELQKRVLTNFLNVLKQWYGSAWNGKDNVFLSAAGFIGAIDFFKNKLIPYCNARGDYRLDAMKSAMRLQPDLLLKRTDLKGLQGRNAARQVTERLIDLFVIASQPQGALKI